jgi:hypothetical protein
MLAYIESNGIEPKDKLTEQELLEHYNRARAIFGDDFHNEVQRKIDDYAKHIEFKKFFNGQIVSELTGLTGKELGNFMRLVDIDLLKHRFNAIDNMHHKNGEVAELLKKNYTEVYVESLHHREV